MVQLVISSGRMKTLNANQLQHASIGSNALRMHKRTAAARSRVDRTKAIAAPERMQQDQQDTIRLLDLERGEEKRLEQTDAFKELVALNKQKQSVNRPQQVCVCRNSHMSMRKLPWLQEALKTKNTLQAEKLDFRQSPTFADCFPSSEKCYKELDHEGTKLRVSSVISWCSVLFELCPSYLPCGPVQICYRHMR